jgi:hypothetical protein
MEDKLNRIIYLLELIATERGMSNHPAYTRMAIIASQPYAEPGSTLSTEDEAAIKHHSDLIEEMAAIHPSRVPADVQGA